MNTSKSKRKTRKQHAYWIEDQRICSCGSRRFTILRERVDRKVHARNSHRKRFVAVCANGHKTRIGFPSSPRKKK